MIFTFLIQIDGRDVLLHEHPCYYAAVPVSGDFVLRTAPGRTGKASVQFVGKNGKPYPAVRVQRRDDNSWHTKTLARLVRECVSKMVLNKKFQTHHLKGFPKTYSGVDGTEYMDWHIHGRESSLKRWYGSKE